MESTKHQIPSTKEVPSSKFQGRRAFWKSMAKAAAIVALAPQLAFRAKMDPVKVAHTQELVIYWTQTSRLARCTSEEYDKALGEFLTSHKRYVLKDPNNNQMKYA